MMSVGLTGGIGSGKSVVAKFFITLGVPVYNSDDRARKIMETKDDVKNKIKELIGKDAFTEGMLNKKYIADKIFQDISLRDSLNDIVHSAVFEDYMQFTILNQDSDYIIQESAILFEGGYENRHDFMITVISPEELKIKRLVEKGMNELDIKLRMNNQWPDKDKTDKSDFIILNNEKNSIINQVIDIHNKLLIKSV